MQRGMNKKGGILDEESIKLIVAIICILGLIYLGVKLYGIFTTSAKLEQAKASLNDINNILKNLKDRDNTPYILLAPSNSYIMSFSDGNGRPGCFAGKPCTCICDLKLNIFSRITHAEIIREKQCSIDVLYCLATDRTIVFSPTEKFVDEIPLKLSFSKLSI